MSIEAIRELGTLASVCPELNMANYGEDDVRHLNDWAIEMSLLAEKVAAAPQPSQATQAEVTDEQILATGREWSKEQGWWDFEVNDFLGCARAILALRPQAVQAEVTDFDLQKLWLKRFKGPSHDPVVNYARAILALRPQAVPMTDTQLCEALGIDGSDDWTYQVRDAVEAHHGTTAQPKKEGA